MSTGLYVALMLGIMAVVLMVTVPSLLWKKCEKCGDRNGLDATECRACEHPFPKE